MAVHVIRHDCRSIPACLPRVFRLLALALALPLTTECAEALKIHFDLPADSAEKSLKRFSEQAGREVLFASQVTRGIRVNPVKGEMLPRTALDRLLANTGLIAVHDLKTGAFSVRKETPEEAKNGQRAAQKTTCDRPMKPSPFNLTHPAT